MTVTFFLLNGIPTQMELHSKIKPNMVAGKLGTSYTASTDVVNRA